MTPNPPEGQAERRFTFACDNCGHSMTKQEGMEQLKAENQLLCEALDQAATALWRYTGLFDGIAKGLESRRKDGSADFHRLANEAHEDATQAREALSQVALDD